MSDSVLTLNKLQSLKYNLPDVATYPSVVDENGLAKTNEIIGQHYKLLNEDQSTSGTFSLSNEEFDQLRMIVRVPMPRRSLLVLYGAMRYSYEHSILREDLPQRRVCITYRELTPPFLQYGDKSSIGEQILKTAKKFWDHKDVYKDHLMMT